jgi:sugar (pentulose or hexulose) kinase
LSGTDYFVGLDLGTSGCRAAAVDADGTPLAEATRPFDRHQRDATGRSEQPPAMWWETASYVLRKLGDRLAGRPRGIAVDGTSGTVLAVGRGGEPLGPGLMYDDSRCRSVLPALAALAPAQAPVHGTGSSCAKLLWLTRNGLPDGTTRILHQAEWITGQLSGRFDVGDENNCLKLGYDPQVRRWPKWLNEIGLPGRLLPEPKPVGTRVGFVTSAACRATGLPRGTPVYAGTTDSTAAALAAGLQHPGDAMTSLGSTLVVKILCEKPVAAPAQGVYSHRLFERWLAGGASNSGGVVLRQYFSDAEIAALSERIDPANPTGLDYYPLPAPGERFPVNDPMLEPRLSPRPADPATFLQGLLEGIAGIECRGYEVLAELGAPRPTRIFTSGGGAGNEAWEAIRRRLLGVPVTAAMHATPAVGAALVARHGALASGQAIQ